MLSLVGVFMIGCVGTLLLIGMVIVGTTWEVIVRTFKVLVVIAAVMVGLFLFHVVTLVLGL
jgi:hypothetical protein